MTTVVLGAGPVGLAAAEILRADYCVGQRPGGAALLRNLAPTYLWRTPATVRLLHELGFSWAGRTARFGWVLPGGKLADFAPPADRLAYYRRSRGLPPDSIVEVPASAASSGKSGELETFSAGIEELTTTLLSRVDVTEAVVESVEFEGEEALVRLDCASEPIRASALVNTLPAPTFRRLTGSVFESIYAPSPKCFVLGDAWSYPIHREWKRFVRGKGREFLYVADAETPFERVKFLRDEMHHPFPCSYEFNSKAPPVGFLDAVNGRLALSAPLQIPPDAPEVPRVEWGGIVWNVGRLARWSHSIRLHDAVEELYREGVDG